LSQIRLVIFEKNAKNVNLIPKSDVTEPKARRLGYSNYQLKSCLQIKEQCQTSDQKSETDLKPVNSLTGY